MGGGYGPRSTPAAGGNSVYAYSSDMVLQCPHANSGKPVWAKDIVKEFGGKNIGWKSAMSPVLKGGLVFVADGGSGAINDCVQSTDRGGGLEGQRRRAHACDPGVASLHSSGDRAPLNIQVAAESSQRRGPGKSARPSRV